MQIIPAHKLLATPSYNNYSELIIEPKLQTPFIKLQGDKGILMIKGSSTEINRHNLIFSLITLVDEHLQFNDKLTCYFFFKDFNANTAKALFDLFKELKAHSENSKKIHINWFADHENTEMIETGIDYSDLFEMNFNVQPV